MKLSPSDILKRHAIERYLRGAIRSANLDGDLGQVPRMSEGAWVNSCQLVAGVDPAILDVIGVRECRAAGATWDWVALELPDETMELPTEQVARPPTLAQAARWLGLNVPQARLAAMRLEAVQRVTENMLRRGGRGATLSGAQEGASS